MQNQRRPTRKPLQGDSNEIRTRMKRKKGKRRMQLLALLGILMLFIIIAISSGGNKEDTTAANEAVIANSATTLEAMQQPTLIPTSVTTIGEQNALASANSYLQFMSFSYIGLEKQLMYDGYTSDEAKYAVDNCGADWNEQAAKKAASYLELMSFSRQGLIDQLEYDEFTHEQAIYGVTQVGY